MRRHALQAQLEGREHAHRACAHDQRIDRLGGRCIKGRKIVWGRIRALRISHAANGSAAPLALMALRD